MRSLILLPLPSKTASSVLAILLRKLLTKDSRMAANTEAMRKQQGAVDVSGAPTRTNWCRLADPIYQLQKHSSEPRAKSG
jgi:hypothetical protein